jgi:hypothetical protein
MPRVLLTMWQLKFVLRDSELDSVTWCLYSILHQASFLWLAPLSMGVHNGLHTTIVLNVGVAIVLSQVSGPGRPHGPLFICFVIRQDKIQSHGAKVAAIPPHLTTDAGSTLRS